MLQHLPLNVHVAPFNFSTHAHHRHRMQTDVETAFRNGTRRPGWLGRAGGGGALLRRVFSFLLSLSISILLILSYRYNDATLSTIYVGQYRSSSSIPSFVRCGILLTFACLKPCPPPFSSLSLHHRISRWRYPALYSSLHRPQRLNWIHRPQQFDCVIWFFRRGHELRGAVGRCY